jgi:hypothetical protein
MKPIISQSEIEKLSYKYQAGTITSSEKQLLDKWYDGHDDSFFYHSDDKKKVKQRVWQGIHKGISIKQITKLWPKLVAAACILLASGVAIYLVIEKKTSTQTVFTGSSRDINPGGQKAFLILSDGQRIDLNSSNEGTIANQTGTEIKKINSGTLAYTKNPHARGMNNNGYNTIETPAGGEYQLILPDGTKIWLNASSSLRYPVSFDGEEKRTVSLTGEAYFEVAKDQSHPFEVSTLGQKITVLGTHFNVNSYLDEPGISTALLEGSVMVSNGKENKKLHPGERSINEGNQIQVLRADLSQDVAWKNGYFEFSDTDLKTVMRQISRWYGLRVTYKGKMPSKRFTGKIHRNLKLSSALKILSYFEVNFTVSDKNILINN